MSTPIKPSLLRKLTKTTQKTTNNHLLDETYKNIMMGRFENCPSLGTRMIKIFLSSTFADMAKERNVIMKYLYPQLRLYCRQNYGIEFQILDMRWGVPSDSQLDHRGPELCFQEINNCKEISCGINFVTIVGHRYGTISLPYSIKGSDFVNIVSILRVGNISTDILEQWYVVDNNNDPPIYTLRPIPTTSNEPTVDEIKTARQEWSDIENTLASNITKAIDILIGMGKMNVKDKKKFCSSVTEQEIELGICTESQSRNDKTAAAFIREIVDIGTFLNNPKVQRYIDVKEVQKGDTSDEVEVVVDDFLNEIMHNIIDVSIKSSLGDSNIRYFKTTWDDMNRKDNDSQYFSNFKSEFIDVVKRIIDQNMADSKDTSDDIYNEVLQHVVACVKHVKHFQGRVDLLNEVKNYVQGGTNIPFVVYGESGSGKTSILAKSAFLTRSWLDNEDAENAIIILRFLGTSLGTSNIRKTIRYMCRQLRILSGEDDNISKLDDFKELLQTFYQILSKMAEFRKVIIFLDSIDQLQANDGAYTFSWLQTPLPLNVKMVLSTLPHHEQILDNLRLRFEDQSHFLEVKPLDPSTCMDILVSLLREKERTINEQQRTILVEAFKACSLPIYVNLVYRTVLKWKSYYTDTTTALQLKYTVREAIFQFFRNLEKIFNKTFVRHSLAYITASRNGLSESELEDILSLDDKVLQGLFVHHLPPQIRVPPFLWSRVRQEIGSYLVEREADNCRVLYWYHRQFIEVAHEYLLSDKLFKTYIHDNMSDYFLGTYSNNKSKRFYYPPNLAKKLDLPPYTDEGRNMPNQPLIYNQAKDISIRYSDNLYNYRKINELPWHLANAGRLAEFADHVAFNYDFIRTKLMISSRSSLLEDLSLLQGHPISFQNSLTLLYNAIRLSTLSLSQDPLNISFDLIGRLSKYDNQSNSRVMDLLNQCRKQSHFDIGFIPKGQCLESGSGLLYLWYDIGLSMGIVLPNDQLMTVSMIDSIITYYDSDGNIIKTIETDVNIFMALKMLMNRRPSIDQPHISVILNKPTKVERNINPEETEDVSEEKEKEKNVKMIYQLNLFSGRLTEVKELNGNISDDSVLDMNDRYIQVDTRTGMAKLINYRDDRCVYEYSDGVTHTCLGLDDALATIIYVDDESHQYMGIIDLSTEQITTVAIAPGYNALCCYNLPLGVVMTMFKVGDDIHFHQYQYSTGVVYQLGTPIIVPFKRNIKRVKVLSFSDSKIIVFTNQYKNKYTEGPSTHGFVYNGNTNSILPLTMSEKQSESYRNHCNNFGDSVQGLVSEIEDLLILNGEKCLLMTWSLLDGSLLQVISMGTAEGLLSGIFTEINKVALCHFPDETLKDTDERMYILEKLYNIDALKEPMKVIESVVNDDVEILDEHLSFVPNKHTYREFSKDLLEGLLLIENPSNTFVVDCVVNSTLKLRYFEAPFLNLTLLGTFNDSGRVAFTVDNTNSASTEIIDISKSSDFDAKVYRFCIDSSLVQRLNPRKHFLKKEQKIFALTTVLSDWIIWFDDKNDISDRSVVIDGFNTKDLTRKTIFYNLDIGNVIDKHNETTDFKINKLKLCHISLRNQHKNQVVLMYSSSDRKHEEVLKNIENRVILWSGVIVILEIERVDTEEIFRVKEMSSAVADIGQGLALLNDGVHGINYKMEKIDITTGTVVDKVGQLESNTYILDPLLIDEDRYLIGTKWIGPCRVFFSIGLDNDDDSEEMFASFPPRTVLMFDLACGRLVGNYPFENDPETMLVSRSKRFFSILTMHEPIRCIELNNKPPYDVHIETKKTGKRAANNGNSVQSSYGYLKLVLSQAMQEIVNKRPQDPIAYLATYLSRV